MTLNAKNGKEEKKRFKSRFTEQGIQEEKETKEDKNCINT